MNKTIPRLIISVLLSTLPGFAETLAPGGPGEDAQWASAGKQGVATAVTLESKVWFTLQGGMLTEVYYPDVTVANVRALQFFVKDQATGKVETESDDSFHRVKVLRADSLTFQQLNTAKSGGWTIRKTYTADPGSDSVLFEVEFKPNRKNLALYLFYDPSLGNSGMHDTAEKTSGYLTAHDGSYASALLVSNPAQPDSEILSEQANGFYGTSDGLTQLRNGGRTGILYDRAVEGNVVQTALVGAAGKFTVVLAFAETPDSALQKALAARKKGFAKCRAEYEKGWEDYVKTLPKVAAKYQTQFNLAAMVLKAHEDKTHRGANIASLSVPWGGGENANENNAGGYHLVWSRDLYQVATAYLALGDNAAAERALDFVFNVQQKPDGSFPQNSFLDGRPYWSSLQLDEVAYPLILAHELGRNDRATYQNHVRKAADFLVQTGPATPQERWEEEGGYSPSTIAAEIAGLVCAAAIAKKNGDDTSAAVYLATADKWQAGLENWTATTTGKYGDGNYYLRITQNGTPDAGEPIELNNGGGTFDEREIVDAGFLELVRLGIKAPDDLLIEKSIEVVDQVIRVDTPNGAGFYRYNHDGYGEMDDGRRWNWDGKYSGRGRLWPLLSGERGQYELAAANASRSSVKKKGDKEGAAANTSATWLRQAYARLDALANFANDGLMIPEQVWDQKEVPEADSRFSPDLEFGEGTGSATPLAWSMAQFIRLALNLKAGRNLDTPQIVWDRYVKKRAATPGSGACR